MPAFEGLWGTASFTHSEQFCWKLYAYNYTAQWWELLSVVWPLKTASRHDAGHAATDGTVGCQGDNPGATSRFAVLVHLALPIVQFDSIDKVMHCNTPICIYKCMRCVTQSFVILSNSNIAFFLSAILDTVARHRSRVMLVCACKQGHHSFR